MDTLEKTISSIDPVVYLIFFVTVIIIILSIHRSDGCDISSGSSRSESEYFASSGSLSESRRERVKYIRIFPKNTKFYFLTVNNKLRRDHIKEEFKEYSPIEINPVTQIPRYRSGSTGFARMVDKGLRDQDRTKPFQPFILLEDDASMYRPIPEYLDIPIDADLVYLGLSYGLVAGHHSKTVYSEDYDKDLMIVRNMLALHGVMVCSATGAALMERCMMESYYLNTPWDIPITNAQPFYKVYAYKIPLIYQEKKYGGQEKPTKIVATSDWFQKMPALFVENRKVANLMSSDQEIIL